MNEHLDTLFHLCNLADKVGECNWCVLPDGHDEHPTHHRGFAILGSECERIDLYHYKARETDEACKERALALVEILNMLGRMSSEVRCAWNRAREGG